MTWWILAGVVAYLLVGGFCAVLFGMTDTHGGRYLATIAWPLIVLFLEACAVFEAPCALFVWLKWWLKRKAS